MTGGIIALIVVLGACLLGACLLLALAAREHHVRRQTLAAHPVVAAHLGVMAAQLRAAQQETLRLQQEMDRERHRFTGPPVDDERRTALRLQTQVRTRHYEEG